MQLKSIYDNELHAPIDSGGVEALIPGSTAYSHLCQTNVPSYAIAGSWEPNGIQSHLNMEFLFKNILGNPQFDLDIDGFQGNFQGNNDLQVNLTSQAGGLHSTFRWPTDNSPNTLPDESAIYSNTVHAKFFVAIPEQNIVHHEIDSSQIKNDVVTLLNSPDSKFASAIGIGSSCNISK